MTLDFFRHEFALHSESPSPKPKSRNTRRRSANGFRAPWRYEDEDDIPTPASIRTESLARYSRRETRSIGPQSGYGQDLCAGSLKRNYAIP